MVLMVCAMLVAAAASLAQPDSRDERLAADVREALASSGFDNDSVEVRVNRGVVVLTGTVSDAREKLRAIRAAFTVSGVEELETEIGVLEGITPHLEEEIWQALFAEGLEALVSEVLVRDGVAMVRGEVGDMATGERILRVAGSVPGIDSVRNEIAVPGAEGKQESPVPPAMPVEPEPVEPEPVEPEPVEPEPVEPEPVEPEPVEPEPVEPEPVEPEPVEPEPVEPEPVEPEHVEPEPVEPEHVEPEPVEPEHVEPSVSGEETSRVESWSSNPPTLSHQIAYAILTYSGYTVFDYVQFSLEGADVALVGAVTVVSKKRELEDRMREIPGVGSVQNELRVLPASKDDERLREKLFQRIYQDPLFAGFANDRNPPVHILVDAGIVTLVGVVDEPIERMSAEGIVRNVFGVTFVRNQIRVRER